MIQIQLLTASMSWTGCFVETLSLITILNDSDSYCVGPLDSDSDSYYVGLLLIIILIQVLTALASWTDKNVNDSQ